MADDAAGTGKLAVFQDKKIRRIWHNNEWFFSVVDVVGSLTDSDNPNNYWKVLKHREAQLVTICNQLKLQSLDGKYYSTDCVNTEGAFRLIQSVPSPKAEPFKLWLAKTGYERVKEIENPELAQERAKSYYELKGYPKDWIEKRIRGIAIRQELTDEWKNRGVQGEKNFAILTDEIAIATFGKSIKEHKEIKGLDPRFENENLRDNMTDLELIFSMLGEKATTEITKAKDSKGYGKCLTSAIEGGTIAGNARRELEKKTGKPVVSNENYIHLTDKNKEKKLINEQQ